jgi:hypothetical protein
LLVEGWVAAEGTKLGRGYPVFDRIDWKSEVAAEGTKLGRGFPVFDRMEDPVKGDILYVNGEFCLTTCFEVISDYSASISCSLTVLN